MAATFDVTHPVFIHPKCHFKMEKDYRSVVATGNIQTGDLLILEHCYYQDPEKTNLLKMTLRFQPELFNELNPRSIPWDPSWADSAMPAAISDLIAQKLDCNVFLNSEEDKVTLSRSVAWINHESNPNAYLWTYTVDTKGALPMDCYFVAVIAGGDIFTGDEITIRYNPIFDAMYPTKFPNRCLSLDFTPQAQIQILIEKYAETEIFGTTMVNQIANHLGLYRVGDTMILTPRFMHQLESDDDPMLLAQDWLKQLEMRVTAFRS